jgi:hypothetical protein
VSNFVEKMQEVAQKILNRMDKVIGNEQATKDSLIKPFFNALGIDTEDPDCWQPEYRADFSGKKNPEKVDYVVKQDGKPLIFIEAKPYAASDKGLISRDGQLARYFNAIEEVKISIITNGVVYRFFSDLASENIQDGDPFFVFDVRNHNKADIEVLEMFSPGKYDIKGIKSWANENKSKLRIQKFLYSILTKPEENKEFINFVVDQNHDGKNTVPVREAYAQKLSILMKEAVDLCIGERLNLARTPEIRSTLSTVDNDQVVTTTEELNVLAAVKGVIAGSGRDVQTVVHKDYPKWFNISAKKAGNWFVRLYFRDDSKVLLVRLPFAKAAAMLKDAEKLQERQAGVAITLDSDLNVGLYARILCEAFDIYSSVKQQESDSESIDADLDKIA